MNSKEYAERRVKIYKGLKNILPEMETDLDFGIRIHADMTNREHEINDMVIKALSTAIGVELSYIEAMKLYEWITEKICKSLEKKYEFEDEGELWVLMKMVHTEMDRVFAGFGSDEMIELSKKYIELSNDIIGDKEGIVMPPLQEKADSSAFFSRYFSSKYGIIILTKGDVYVRYNDIKCHVLGK